MEKGIKKKTHYILVDAEYADAVAGRLRNHYAQVLGREMPRLDLADWLTCCALDCGLQQGENNVEVCIFHESGKEELEHFVPAHLANELDKQGFDVPGLADFTVNCAVKEDIVEGAPLPVQAALFILHDTHCRCLRALAGSATRRHRSSIAPLYHHGYGAADGYSWACCAGIQHGTRHGTEPAGSAEINGRGQQTSKLKTNKQT